jgi:hypothetical protein
MLAFDSSQKADVAPCLKVSTTDNQKFQPSFSRRQARFEPRRCKVKECAHFDRQKAVGSPQSSRAQPQPAPVRRTKPTHHPVVGGGCSARRFALVLFGLTTLQQGMGGLAERLHPGGSPSCPCGSRHGAQTGLQGCNLCRAESLRPHERAFALSRDFGDERLAVIVAAARIVPAERCGAMLLTVVFHRDHVMDPVNFR